ncbi:N-formylglutamate amidohydrolase [Iodidimonas gelatinilytica]|uniref:N-formylglutamate amidohydrolase n=1 Tax=Iodidimonas gelatinilytica TaxID=1236966 RepID=A0A5A7MUF6_9PROT|nr:N-formylglutamate amidohydrolase [Iodidimonas gelatinilytica]GEQ99456.1 N-formylglutamate amidohydrolase [Iodidimonas gelatinilytica]
MKTLDPVLPTCFRPEGSGGALILCDHASNHIPPALDGLGLDPEYLDCHIAVDIGAATVSERLSYLLDAPAILANVSRLVVDPNRDPHTQNPIPQTSDGVDIPGNQGLSAAQHTARLDAYFHPYHRACEDQRAAMMAAGQKPVVIGLHSFTPVMNGIARPWEIGFLYAGDDRLYRSMRGPLAQEWGLNVGDNEPYSGTELYYSMHRHGEAHGLMQATIELRQDLIGDQAGQERFAHILAQVLRPIIKAQQDS